MSRTTHRFAGTAFILIVVAVGSVAVFSFHTKPAHAVSWYSASWPYRQAITINHSLVSNASGTTLTNFPVLISLASDTNLSSFASSTGNDILFTSADGVTKLSHEVESYSSSTGQLVAWVNIPSLTPATNTIVYMYFGNSTATSSQQNVTGTWNSNFAGVYHFPSTVGWENDSTANANNVTLNNNNIPTPDVTGEVGSGILMNFNKALQAPSSTSLNITGPLTLEGWIYFGSSTVVSNINNSLVYGDSSNNNNDIAYQLALFGNGNGTVNIRTSDGVGGNLYPSYSTDYVATLATSTWYHVVTTYTGTQWLLYLNGTLVNSVNSTTTPPGLTGPFDIGGSSSGGNLSFSGSVPATIDEIRISSVARSTDWINTEYNNESNPSIFESFGGLQTDVSPTIASFSSNPGVSSSTVTSTLSWNVTGANTIMIAPGGFSTSTASGSIAVNVASTTIFTLSAGNANGTSTATTTVVIDSTPPSVPANVTVTAASSTGMYLSWTASTDNVSAAGYDIYRGASTSTIAKIATSSASNYTDNNLTPSTTYYYQVDAYDAVGNFSSQSSIASGTTLVPGTTVITVSSTIDVSNVKRFGINLSLYDGYDGGQIFKNIIADNGNPGFQSQLYQNVIPCSTTSGANDCSDANNSWASYNYDTWPANFWAGATYEIITGQAAGRTGTIVSSNAPDNCNTSYPCGPTDFTLSSGTPAIGLGDYMVIRQTVNNITIAPSQNTSFEPIEGWFTSNVGGNPTTTVDTNDLASSSPGTQALNINALGSSTYFGLTQYFDGGCCNYPNNFLRLNGTYQLQFKAKGLGGTNSVNIDVERYANYLNQSVNLASGTWQTYTYTFTATETAQESPLVARLDFNLNNSAMDIADVSLQQINTDPTNQTVFNDGIVDTLKTLSPGIIRDWSNQLGDSLNNSIAPIFARKTVHSLNGYGEEGMSIGLNDFLQLCQTVGAEPWYVLPTNWDPSDMTNLMQFLGGNGSTTYGAMRIALNGTSTPWTSVFPQMHFEFGNENWNSGFAGGAIGNAVSYATRANQLFTAAKASPYYVPSSFQFIVGGQVGNTGEAAILSADTPEADAISEAPYLSGDNNSSTASNNALAFGDYFGEVEHDSHGGVQSQVAQSSSLPIVDYEEGIGTGGGSITQAQVNNYVPSLGAGLASGNELLIQLRDLGINGQNIFDLDQDQFTDTDIYGNTQHLPIWGEAPDPENTALVRPTFLSEELANLAVGTSSPSIMKTTQSGDNPTWTQTIENGGSPISGVTSHYIQAYAFSNHSLVLFNLSTTSSLPVNLAGADLPSGNVTIEQLTSANITDNNETTSTVVIATNSVSNFNPATTITLPPYSMTDYIEDASSSATPPSTPTGLTATSTSSSQINLSWSSSTAGTYSVAGYNIYQCVGSSCNPTTFIATSSGASYISTGLVASTTYGYAVAALDTNGNVSTSSASAYATTGNAATPPPPPQSLAATPGNASISLSWSAPTSTGGSSLTGYLLYDRFTGSSTFAFYATTTQSQTNATATSLTNGQSYDFEVLAQNSTGTSTPSSIVSSTPYTVPNAPTSVSATAGNAEATISFSAPVSNGGSAITSYTATSNTGNHTASSTGSPISVMGLTNGQVYTFTVVATNAAGNSASSSASNSVTPSNLDPTISSFSASFSDIEPGVSSTLSWTTTNASSVSINQGIGNQSATSTGSITITPTSTLTYTLTATNSNGSSTAETTIIVDGTPPSVPTSLVANPVSTSEIDLSWASSTDNVGVAGYGIYQGLSTSTMAEIATTTNLTYANTGLSAGTTYYYAVTAYDAAGNVSGESSSTSATTQSAPVSSGGGGGGGYISPITSPTTGGTTSTVSSSGGNSLSSLLSIVTEVRSLSLELFLSDDNNQNLTIGSTGENVWALQVFLITNNILAPRGPAGNKLTNPTSYFGALTKGALAAYQTQAGITPASGFLGPQTRSHLESIGGGGVIQTESTPPNVQTTSISLTPTPVSSPSSLSIGDEGPSVTILQNSLVQDGFLSPGSFTPGTFDVATLRAVETLQCTENILCSGPGYGNVGPRTQAKLNSL
jgi:hypothetical protein